VLGAEFDQLVRDAEGNHRTLLDRYGATNPAEFFAVATEAFFEKPRQLRSTHRALYDQLQQFYRQDPAALHAGRH
jgi:Mlc titration factor MtfA (ptsG expression regulator)